MEEQKAFEYNSNERNKHTLMVKLPSLTAEKLEKLIAFFKPETKTDFIVQMIEYVYNQHASNIESTGERDTLAEDLTKEE